MPLPAAIRFAESGWIPYKGPKGGVGWQNQSTGKVVYQEKQPGASTKPKKIDYEGLLLEDEKESEYGKKTYIESHKELDGLVKQMKKVVSGMGHSGMLKGYEVAEFNLGTGELDVKKTLEGISYVAMKAVSKLASASGMNDQVLASDVLRTVIGAFDSAGISYGVLGKYEAGQIKDALSDSVNKSVIDHYRSTFAAAAFSYSMSLRKDVGEYIGLDNEELESSEHAGKSMEMLVDSLADDMASNHHAIRAKAMELTKRLATTIVLSGTALPEVMPLASVSDLVKAYSLAAYETGYGKDLDAAVKESIDNDYEGDPDYDDDAPPIGDDYEDIDSLDDLLPDVDDIGDDDVAIPPPIPTRPPLIKRYAGGPTDDTLSQPLSSPEDSETGRAIVWHFANVIQKGLIDKVPLASDEFKEKLKHNSVFLEHQTIKASPEVTVAMKHAIAVDCGKGIDDRVSPERVKAFSEFVRKRGARSYSNLKGRLTDGEVAAAELVTTWAHSSDGSSDLSWALQHAAEEMFGLKDPYRTTRASTPYATKGKEILEEYGDVIGAFMEHTYEQTQAMLADAGIKHVTLYRGITMSTAQKNRLNLDTVAIKSFSGSTTIRRSGRDGEDVSMQPLSSFSTSPGTAAEFGEVMIAAVVPAEAIFSSAFTGTGCLNESELVVLSHKMNATVLDFGDSDSDAYTAKKYWELASGELDHENQSSVAGKSSPDDDYLNGLDDLFDDL